MAAGRIPTTANSPLTAKGDLFTYSTAPARLAVGNDGEQIVADSSASVGLRYQPTNAAGKNCIINGGMDIFQRTSFNTNAAYALDRWYMAGGGNQTVTQSTAKTTPNSQYMMLMTASTTQQIFCHQVIETKNAVYYAGKTVTLSAYAAGLTTTTNYIMILSYSTSVDETIGGTWTDITVASGNANLTLSSTVTRWSAQYAVPSNAKSLKVLFVNNAANITVGQGIYLGDVQLEVGSVATAFSRAGGTIQGELSACLRYYWRMTQVNSASGYAYIGNGFCETTTVSLYTIPFPVQMRTNPTLGTSGTANQYMVYDAGTIRALTVVPSSDGNSVYTQGLVGTTTGLTAGRGVVMRFNNNNTAYLDWSAEL